MLLGLTTQVEALQQQHLQPHLSFSSCLTSVCLWLSLPCCKRNHTTHVACNHTTHVARGDIEDVCNGTGAAQNMATHLREPAARWHVHGVHTWADCTPHLLHAIPLPGKLATRANLVLPSLVFTTGSSPTPLFPHIVSTASLATTAGCNHCCHAKKAGPARPGLQAVPAHSPSCFCHGPSTVAHKREKAAGFVAVRE